MCWSKYERHLRGEQERHKEKETDEEREREILATAAEKRAERLLAEHSRQRELVRS